MKPKFLAIALSTCYLSSCAGLKNVFTERNLNSDGFNPLSSPSSQRKSQAQESQKIIDIQPLPTDTNPQTLPPSQDSLRTFKKGEIVIPMLPNIGFFNNKPNNASVPDAQIPGKEKLTVISSDETYTKVSRPSGKTGYVLTITVDRASAVATMPPITSGPLPSENNGNTILGSDLIPVIDPAAQQAQAEAAAKAAKEEAERQKNLIVNPAAISETNNNPSLLTTQTPEPKANNLLEKANSTPVTTQKPTEKNAIIVKPAIQAPTATPHKILSAEDEQKLLDEVKGTLKK